MEAIYLMSPTGDSIGRLIDDFSRSKQNKEGRLYACAHVFLTSQLDDRMLPRLSFICKYCVIVGLFFRLKSSTAFPFIKTLKEMNLDFIALESQVFTLEKPHSLLTFFGTEVQQDQVLREYLNMAKQIASLCISHNEFPYIRYALTQVSDRLTSRLAALVYEELDKYARTADDFPSTDPAVSGPNRAVLLIVDRTVDNVAPLLHEFTYQAMINDLLTVYEGGTKYRYSYQSATEGLKEKEVLLDETIDQLWASLRHSHIAECNETLVNNFNKFLNENRAAMGLSGRQARPDGVKSLKDLKETLSAVPQFQELKSKFSVHINIAQECMAIFSRNKLADLAGVEQTLATGETADGDRPKHIEVDMIPLLDDPNLRYP
jgi:syntaxin-binding protein 1